MKIKYVAKSFFVNFKCASYSTVLLTPRLHEAGTLFSTSQKQSLRHVGHR